MTLYQRLRRLARAVLPRFVLLRELKKVHERTIAQTGEAELLEMGRFVRAGDLCLDVGSNIGVYSYLFAKLGARVIAFEPNPAVARTVRLLPGIDVRDEALSSSNGVARLTVPLDHHGLSTLREEAGLTGRLRVHEVNTRRLDDLGIDGVRFIKVDVEGLEERVLDGAEATIARDRPALMIEVEERHNPGGLARIAPRLRALGYEGFFLAGGWRPLIEFDPARHQRLEDVKLLDVGVRQRDTAYVNNFLFLPAGSIRESLA